MTVTIQPPEFPDSVYAAPRRPRAASLPQFTTLRLNELFPEIDQKIYGDCDDLLAIRRAAEASLASVDMSRIAPGDTVNLLASEHGFSILGGGPYVEMLKTIRDVVIGRTSCRNIRLRLAMYRGFREAEEVNAHFELEDVFEGRVKGLGPTVPRGARARRRRRAGPWRGSAPRREPAPPPRSRGAGSRARARSTSSSTSGIPNHFAIVAAY